MLCSFRTNSGVQQTLDVRPGAQVTGLEVETPWKPQGDEEAGRRGWGPPEGPSSSAGEQEEVKAQEGAG